MADLASLSLAETRLSSVSPMKVSVITGCIVYII